MSNTNDFVIEDILSIIDGEFLGKKLAKYNGTDKNVIIPDDVTVIGAYAFEGNKKVHSVTIPKTVERIEHAAFSRCTALSKVTISDGVWRIYDEAFKGCSKLSVIKCLSVTDIDDILGNGKKNEIIKPLIFPSISLSKVSNIKYKISLAMGYILEPEEYKGKNAAGYKKFIEENRDLIIETAKRHEIDSVLNRLCVEGEPEIIEESVGIDQMSVADAKELFDISTKDTGVKILRYKGSEKVIDIPRVIGKTNVALVSPAAFRDDVIVRCGAKVFEKLSPNVQFNTYVAMLDGTIKFSVEQTDAMKKYFEKKQVKLLEAAVELVRVDIIGILLDIGELSLEQYTMLIDKAIGIGNAEIIAALTTAKNAVYSPEDVENAENVAIQKEIGLMELSLDDYKKIFNLVKKLGYNYDGYAVHIQGCKNPQARVVIPGNIEGMSVCLDSLSKARDIEELVLEEGIILVNLEGLWSCSKLKSINIPSTADIYVSRLNQNITEVIISPDNPYYASDNGMIYSKDFSTLICCPEGKCGTVVLHDGVKVIKDYAFSCCVRLSDIVIPASVTEICPRAFAFVEPLNVWNGAEYVKAWPFAIHSSSGSYAEQYAKEHGISFVTE